MADSTTQIDQVSNQASQREITINELFDASSPAAFCGRHASACLGLQWGTYGGRYGGTTYSNTTTALNANAVNYLVREVDTGEIMLSDGSHDFWADSVNFQRLYVVTTGSATATSWQDHRAGPGGILGAALPAPAALPIELQVACSDLVTPLSTGLAKAYARAPRAFELSDVRASLLVASSSGEVEIDVKVDGVSIFDSPLTIDAGDATSIAAITAFSFATGAESVPDDAIITFDIVATGTDALGLIVTLIGARS